MLSLYCCAIYVDANNVRHSSSCKVPDIFFSYFNQIWSISTDFRKNPMHQILRKSVQWQRRWYMRTGGRTDRHDEAKRHFPPKNPDPNWWFCLPILQNIDVFRSSCKVTDTVVQFYQIWSFSTDFRRCPEYQFQETLSRGVALIHTNTWAHRRTWQI
jgi:hypothetical protein